MKCPRCESEMTGGAPHCESFTSQMECHTCGMVIGITDENVMYRWKKFESEEKRKDKNDTK